MLNHPIQNSQYQYQQGAQAAHHSAHAPLNPASHSIASHANPMDASLARSSMPVTRPCKAFMKIGSSIWYLLAGVFLIAAAARTPPFNDGRPYDLNGYQDGADPSRVRNSINDILRLVGSCCLVLGALHRVLDDHARRTMIKHGMDPTTAAANAPQQQALANNGSYQGMPTHHLRVPITVRALEWIRRIGSYIQLVGSILFLVGSVLAYRFVNRFTRDAVDNGTHREVMALWTAGMALITLGLLVKVFTEAMALIRYHFHAEHKQHRQVMSLVGTMMLLPGAILFTIGSALYLANSDDSYRIANILYFAAGTLFILGSLSKLMGDSAYYRTKNTAYANHAKNSQNPMYANNQMQQRPVMIEA